MNIARFWRLLWISGLALLLAACKPSAEFSVSPTPVIAGVAATFDASETTIYNTHKGNAAVSYSWDFGDGTTGAGKVTTHAFATAGTYTVKLSVKDKAGLIGTVTHKVVVQAATAGVTVKVLVQGAGGALLSGAQVAVGNSPQAVSGPDGVASVVQAQSGDAVIVTVSKPGYVAQALRVAVGEEPTGQQLTVVLQAVKQVISISAVETAAVHLADSLGASVSLPANALVNEATGAPATGAARLQLTPWNIQSEELMAMPGNGRAINAAGVEGNLISAGMMTVDFFDAAGNKLQLAAGKTATIQMDLPLYSVNNQELYYGSTIPLWHFDESRGLWVEEGQGVVVYSSSSPTGMAVQAKVGHFSTWNWDYYITEGGPSNNNEINIRCVEGDGTGVPCTIVADVTLPDGSKYYHHGGDINTTQVGAEGLRIVLLPAQASIVWTGTTADGRVGTVTSGPDGTVEILMSPPKTSNFVACKLSDGTATSCDVELLLTRADGSTVAKNVSLPPEGARIVTGVETNSLTWSARSRVSTDASGQYVRYSGTASSNASDDVTIDLNVTTVLASKTVYLKCDDVAEVIDSNGIGQSEAMAECIFNVSTYGNIEQPNLALMAAVTDTPQQSVNFTVSAAPGALVPVVIPPSIATGYLYVYGSGTTVSGNAVYTIGQTYFDLQSLVDGAILLFDFVSGGLVPV